MNKAGRIMLHPLRPADGAAEKTLVIGGPNTVRKGQKMTLHFDFSEEIEESHLEILGKTLIGMFERNTLGVYRVQWGGLEDTPFVRAVNVFRDGLERRRSIARSPEKPIFDVTEINELARNKTPNSLFVAIGTGFGERQDSSSTGASTSPSGSSPRTSDFDNDLGSGQLSSLPEEDQQMRERSNEHSGKAPKGEA